MGIAKLNYPVHTLDSRLLLPADKKLTSKALDDLVLANKDLAHPELSFLEYGTVFKDLSRIFQKPPFRAIFRDQERKIALSLMKRIRFIPSVLEFLDYFKKHDFYTYRHTLAVFALSTILAHDLLGKHEDSIMEAMAGTIHDFGKICVPLQILKKSNPLTRTDKSILEHHSLAGFVLLSYFLRDYESFAARVAKEHHERRDGSGYPLGISLRDKMIEIIAVCDIYDALLSPRPYRPTPFNNRTALEEITKIAKEGKVSWELVQVLISHNRKDRPDFRELKVSTERRGEPPADNLYGVISDEKSDPSKS